MLSQCRTNYLIQVIYDLLAYQTHRQYLTQELELKKLKENFQSSNKSIVKHTPINCDSKLGQELINLTAIELMPRVNIIKKGLNFQPTKECYETEY